MSYMTQRDFIDSDDGLRKLLREDHEEAIELLVSACREATEESGRTDSKSLGNLICTEIIHRYHDVHIDEY